MGKEALVLGERNSAPTPDDRGDVQVVRRGTGVLSCRRPLAVLRQIDIECLFLAAVA